MALPVSAGAIRRLLVEVEASGRREEILAVGGASELSPVLRQQFLRGGAEPGAVRLGAPEGADVYVHVLAGELREEDVALLRRASRTHVPVIAVAVGFAAETTIPYVFATDVVWVGVGEAFPLEAIAHAVAARLGEHGAPLVGRVPLLRAAVSQQLVASLSRRNGLVAAAVWIPRADLPVLALSEFRLVLRLAQAHGVGREVRDLLPELAATLGVGFGLRALARELLDLIPGPGWALRSAIAYGGTRALGEAARIWFARVPTRQPGVGARAWP
jgi:uncharacterized protein (DUF697 family)